MKGIRSRVVVVLAGSTLLAGGLTAAATTGIVGSVAPAIAGGQAHPPCADATLIEYCLKG
jgi:hypothetical protein